jgi:anti-sigma factor ChrR (cupin superfamily)
MSASSQSRPCALKDLIGPYTLDALERREAESLQAHLSTCAECWQEYQSLAPVTSALTSWRNEVLPPLAPMWDRLLQRIDGRVQQERTAPAFVPVSTGSTPWPEPRWEAVAPGISCRLLSTDAATDRVSMLVRLDEGASYPPHQHAGVEELYLLQGELWIDDRQLFPGDYNRAERGSSDQRVWSATGCMCLLITSASDQLRQP